MPLGLKGVDRGVLYILTKRNYMHLLILTLQLYGLILMIAHLYELHRSTFQLYTIYLSIQFSININRSESLNYCCTKTTYPIYLKFTVLIKQANKSLHTDFQDDLIFLKYLQILLIWYHRPILWSCLSPTKQKL